MWGISVTPINIGTTISKNGIAASTIPSNRQLRAFFGSSSRMTKNAITPPMTLNKMGSKNQKLLRRFTCMAP